MVGINVEIEVSKIRIKIGGWGSDLELPTGSVHHILLFMKSCTFSDVWKPLEGMG